MGGQTSRMVREALEDSLYIVRQTNRATYQESVAARKDLESKIQDLRTVRKEMFESAEQEQQRTEMFKQFGSMGSQKKILDQQAEGFAQQFQLPKSYQSIADKYEEEMQKAKDELAKLEQQDKTS
ncbi:hypothetical protein Poli38472_012011 [Pythium oligandrum]|uniref:Uncharacterized protein n=1 Tax=Pythium oligandrum TaxID=41045 RepID=A0A8K1CP27_PYTOL|nr:hypothetical protein Poli38472_012011 [Pythium oligandrum]|eukprot:TMW66895.1 hypothetical protein Poli38472_012011 [Pythium oligandrum]